MDISIEQLVASGLSSAEAQAWSKRLQAWESLADEQIRWQAITTELLTPRVPFAVHELLYQKNYPQHRQQMLPCPAWIPQEGEIAATHLAEWIDALGLSSYDQLHAWSIAFPNEFAAKLSDALSLRFHSPARRSCDLSAGVKHARWYSGATLNIVESCFQADDDAPAVISGDDANRLEVLTYAGLKALTARVANGLAEMGIQPGDRVVISMPMTAEAVAAFLGIIAAGCAAVTIADSFSSTEMAVRLEITQPKCIFTQAEIVRKGKVHPLFEKIAAGNEVPAIVLTTSATRSIPLRANDKSWEDFLSADNILRCVPRSVDDETTILFSSGTTGQPKAIPWDQVTPIKSASDAYFHHDVHPTDVLCWPTNLGWMMGPWLVYATLINRAALALSPSIPTGPTFCEFVEEARVTILGLVPSIVSEWRKLPEAAHLEWKSLRLFSSTGECSNPTDMLWLMSRTGYRPVIEYCGGTETGGGYVTGTLTKPAVPGAFSAKAMGFSWLLLNDEFQESSVGEVFFQPPALGLSTRLLNRDHEEIYYAGIPLGPQQQVLRRHGDQMEELPGGYYRAHGRVDDAMNLGGIKVSSIQIEAALARHAAVQELAAVTIPPPGGGPEQLILYVVLQADIDLQVLHADLQHSLKTCLNPLFRIEAIESIAELPRTASNKVLRRELRNRYLLHHRECNREFPS